MPPVYIDGMIDIVVIGKTLEVARALRSQAASLSPSPM